MKVGFKFLLIVRSLVRNITKVIVKAILKIININVDNKSFARCY